VLHGVPVGGEAIDGGAECRARLTGATAFVALCRVCVLFSRRK
jgi:hypothetical protein